VKQSRGDCHRWLRLPRRCAPRNDMWCVIANEVKQSRGYCHRWLRLPRRCAPRNDMWCVIANEVKQSRGYCHRRLKLPRRCAPSNDMWCVIANEVKQSRGDCHRRLRLPRRCAPRNDTGLVKIIQRFAILNEVLAVLLDSCQRLLIIFPLSGIPSDRKLANAAIDAAGQLKILCAG